MDGHQLDFTDEDCWSELVDYSNLFADVASPDDVHWDPNLLHTPGSDNKMPVNTLTGGTASQASECKEGECSRKRGRGDSYSGTGKKSCRERMRREKLNDRFLELSAVLAPGIPVKTDKLALLSDAIRVVNQLKTESQEYNEMNERLLDEIKTLKAEKSELREEKMTLKADKERMEQQLKAMDVPQSGLVPPQLPLIYQAPVNKMAVFSSYGYAPMWHYLPPSTRDVSQDHELRPPAA